MTLNQFLPPITTDKAQSFNLPRKDIPNPLP
jgi:hypothetical protein